ncbi:OmpA family outer membrane protein [Anopheles sinensis]|uniref:OmpA family outer membrane protein n=1 Tax=Anopheles sinensis TaxID=74873 RepID=A0A084VSY5_ANOSI|nr:OmpA family outer membrane protein [Anopheles sinensis]
MLSSHCARPGDVAKEHRKQLSVGGLLAILERRQPVQYVAVPLLGSASSSPPPPPPLL